MATAVVELGAEGAEALAPEAEALAPKAEELGSKAASKVERLFGKKAATEAAEVGTEEAASAATEEAATEEAATAAEKPAGRQTMDRLMDVGTGVMIGQSLQGSDSGSKAAQGATQTLAAVQAPPGAALQAPVAATGAAERPRDASGRFVSRRRLHRGGFDVDDDDVVVTEEEDSTAVFEGGADGAQGATFVVHKHPRPLAESFQIAILVVLVIIVIAVTITISVKKPSSISSFGYGMLLGAVSGATVYWVLGSRSGRPKSA